MAIFTAEQHDLSEYITSLNSSNRLWAQNRKAVTHSAINNDPSHWAGYGIYTVAQFKHNISRNGIHIGDYMPFKRMSTIV